MVNVEPELSQLILMSGNNLSLTCWCYQQLVLVGDVPHRGVEDAPHPGTGPGHGVEGGGDDEGGDAGEDEADVERRVGWGRDITSHLNIFVKRGFKCKIRTNYS